MSRRTIRRLAWATGFVCVLGVTGAVANDVYRTAMIQAVRAKEKALDTQQATDWREALDEFRSADSIQQTPETKYEIGFAASQLGEMGLALEAYSVALELGLTGPAREKARDYVAAHSEQVSRLVITGAAGTRVFIHGIERGQLPLARPIVVEPPTVTLDLVSKAGDRASRSVKLTSGQIGAVSLLEPNSDVSPQPSVMPDAPDSMQRPLEPVSSKRNAESSPMRNSSYPEPVHRQEGWAFVSAGASLMAISVVSLVVSTNKVSESRRDLSDRCAVQTNGPDTCAHARPGQQESAQSASDSIATWEAVRTGSWVGLSVGLVSVVGGAVWLRSTGPEMAKSARLPSVFAGPNVVKFSYVGSF